MWDTISVEIQILPMTNLESPKGEPLDSSEAVGYQRMDQAFGLSVHSQLQSIAAETPWQSHDVFWVLGVSNFRPPSSNRFWMFWTQNFRSAIKVDLKAMVYDSISREV